MSWYNQCRVIKDPDLSKSKYIALELFFILSPANGLGGDRSIFDPSFRLPIRFSVRTLVTLLRSYVHFQIYCNGCGKVVFLRWWPPSATWASPLFFLSATPGGEWVISFSFKFGVMGWAMNTFHVSSRTVANVKESSLEGGKHYQKIAIASFRLALSK